MGSRRGDEGSVLRAAGGEGSGEGRERPVMINTAASSVPVLAALASLGLGREPLP